MSRIFEVVALRDAGRADDAEALLDRVIAEAARAAPAWEMIHVAVDVLISLGRYRDALALPGRWPRAELEAARAAAGGADVVADVNLAEAHYDLGDWEAAWAALAGLDERANRAPVTRACLSLQRAWILAHRGRGDAALEVWSATPERELPPAFRAEHHYVHAAARLALGETAPAREAVERGAGVAARASSRRNAEILRARVDVAEALWESAERRLRRAAAHPWKRQGGEGLLLHGDVLARLGRADEAERAWRLCVARDPESEAAARARDAVARLRGGT